MKNPGLPQHLGKFDFAIYLFTLLLTITLTACSEEDEGTSTPPPTIEASPYVVNIDWQQNQLTEYDETSGRMSIHFSQDMPEWEEGLSLMVVGTDKVTAVRRVMKVVKQDGQDVTLETQQATMADLFPGQTLKLAFNAPASGASPRTTDGALLPVGVEIWTANGYRSLSDAERQTRDIDDEYKDLTIDQTFFHHRLDTCGMPLFPGKAWSPTFQKFLLDIGLYGQFNFDFGTTVKEINKYLTVETGELLTCYYLIRGEMTLDFILGHKIELSYAETSSTPLPLPVIPTMRFLFMAGSVPVYLVVDANFMAEGGIDLAGKLETSAGLYSKAQIGAAVSWAKPSNGADMASGFKFQTQSEPRFELQTYQPTVKAEGKFDIKASIYPHIEIRFYDFLGIGFDLKPYLANSIKGTAMATIGGDHYISLTDSFSTGIDFASQASLGFANFPLIGPIEIPNGGINLFDHLLYAAPAKVQAPDPIPETKGGIETQIDFNVYDFDATVKGNYTPSGFGLVRFRTDRGKVSTPYAWPVSGKASVRWTPAKGGKDRLIAELLDGDGNVVSEGIVENEDPAGLVGYWKMDKFHSVDFDPEEGYVGKWETTDEFFDLIFTENNIYYDIDHTNIEDYTTGTYFYDNDSTLILDPQTKYEDEFTILQLDDENLVLRYKGWYSIEDEGTYYYIETLYYKRQPDIDMPLSSPARQAAKRHTRTKLRREVRQR